MGAWFYAAYDGMCDVCGNDIMAGDRVRYNDYDELVCDWCGDDFQ